MGNRSEGGQRFRSHGGAFRRSRRVGFVSLAAVVGLIAAGCGSSGSSSSSSTPSGSSTIPSVSISSFTVNIGPTMAKFKALTHFATKGATSPQVGGILPAPPSSTRYVQFDEPYLNAAFADAGYTQQQYRIDNAQ